MAKPTPKKHKKARYTLPSPGSSPGVVYLDENSLEPRISLYTYKADSYQVQQLADLNRLQQLTSNPDFTYWVEIKGFKSVNLFDTLNTVYHINKLVLEDITTTNQRPKFEEYDSYDFAISRMLFLDAEN